MRDPKGRLAMGTMREKKVKGEKRRGGKK